MAIGSYIGRISQVNNRAEGGSLSVFFVLKNAFFFKIYGGKCKLIIISNNDKVIDFYKDLYETCFIEGTYGQVLEFARDKIHLGHKLLTHPLSGSVKPNETPFKSLAISQKTETLDFNSLEIIENAISTYTKFCKQGMRSDRMEYTESIIDDFKEVDFTLIKSAI